MSPRCYINVGGWGGRGVGPEAVPFLREKVGMVSFLLWVSILCCQITF